MWLREGTVIRAVTMLVLALLVPRGFAEGPGTAASNCSCNSGGGHGTACVCPPPVPRLESMGGQSLFWHDPCGSSYRDDFWRCYEHDSCPPTWFASAEALPLFRDADDAGIPYQAVAVLDPDSGDYLRTAVLSSSDFDTEFDPGIRALVGRALGDWYRVEFSYFGTHEWTDSASVEYQDVIAPTYNADGSLRDAGTGNLLSPFTNFGDPGGPAGLGAVTTLTPEVGFDYNDYASIRFSSELHSAEVNVRRRLCMPAQRNYRAEASWLVGLRYMKVSEEFGYYAHSPVPALIGATESTTRVDIVADNDLIGPQLGAMAQFLVHDRAWIDGEVKGALLFNQATTTSNTVWDENTFDPVRFGSEADEDATAFLGEISVNFNYQFAPAWTIRAGYNAYWLTGVALASQNAVLNMDTTLYKPTALNHDGKVVYHGPSLGIVWAR